jgi:inhibitor of cysteine peptidase
MSAATEPPKTITITDQQNGKDVEVPAGGTLVVRLPSNPTTGYSWAVAGDPAPLRFMKTRNLKSNASEPSLGAPGVQELKFGAPATGISKLTLEYRRPWEHGGTPAKTFSVKVNVR